MLDRLLARWRRLAPPAAPGPLAAPAALAPAGTEEDEEYEEGRESIGARLRNLAEDLITLEVNTIVKENMTAGKMPTIPNALLDIANNYVGAFRRLGVDVSAVFELRPPDFVQWATWKTSDEDWRQARVEVDRNPEDRFFSIPENEISFGYLFEFLRWSARITRQKLAGSLSDLHRVLLLRIEDNSDTIRYLLQSNRLAGLRDNPVTVAAIRSRRDVYKPKPRLTPREMLTIRKIWEVGTERVVAQTVIQIDGDVLTRIASDLGAIAGDKTEAEQLLKMHQTGVDIALSRWKMLLDAAKEVVISLTPVR